MGLYEVTLVNSSKSNAISIMLRHSKEGAHWKIIFSWPLYRDSISDRCLQPLQFFLLRRCMQRKAPVLNCWGFIMAQQGKFVDRLWLRRRTSLGTSGACAEISGTNVYQCHSLPVGHLKAGVTMQVSLFSHVFIAVTSCNMFFIFRGVHFQIKA